MTDPFRILSFSILFMAWLTGIATAGPAVSVSSEVTPPTLRLGETARYRVHIEVIGTRESSLAHDLPGEHAPRAPGLDIEYLGTSTRQQSSFSTGGAPMHTATLTLNYRVQAREPGTYRIPEFSIRFRGEEYRVPHAEVTFLAPTTTREGDDPSLLFLELLLPDEKIFIGQTFKASLQLYALDQIPNLRNNFPMKIGDGWAEGRLADTQTRSRGLRDGYHYDIYSRTLTLTPIMSGSQELLYEMEVQALLPVEGSLFDPEPPPPSAPSLFNDPFFRQFNFRTDPRMEYRNLTVATDVMDIEVHPLPAKGRPASFTGAIGEFTLRAFPGDNTVRVGDPLRLRLQIAGQGNFDRILAPALDFGPQWKIYEPEASFRSGDALGFSGVKMFDFTLIPLVDSISSLPEISIAYFDPRSERYEVLTTGEIPLTVLENPRFTAPPESILAAPRNDQPPGDDPAPQLLLSPGHLAPAGTPLYLHPAFAVAQSVPLLALLVFVLIRNRQIRLEKDEQLRRRREARQRLQQLQAGLTDIMAREDLPTLYSRFLQGIRLVLTIPFGNRATAATRQEMDALLDQCALRDDTREALRHFLEEAENFTFSGARSGRGDLLELRLRWEKLLQELEEAVT